MRETPSAVIGKKVELVFLLDFYGVLLTDNQRELMRLHYEEDLSLAEIAEATGVSRQSVHDTLSRAGQQLLQLEEKLGLFRRFNEREKKLAALMDELSLVHADEETNRHLTAALTALSALISEEE